MKNKQICNPVINMRMTGQWLRYLCRRKRISVVELQNKLQITSNQAIYAWFNGKTLPSLDNLCALSHILSVQMDDLIVVDGYEHPFLRKLDKEQKRMLVYVHKINRNVNCA